MRIEVYGKGCAKCRRLAENVHKALEELGVSDAEVEHVTDLDAIASLGPVMTPALVVNGQVVAQGMAHTPKRVAKLIRPFLQSDR